METEAGGKHPASPVTWNTDSTMKSQTPPHPLPSCLLLGKSLVLYKVGEVMVPIAKGLPPSKDLTWWFLQLGLMTL